MAAVIGRQLIPQLPPSFTHAPNTTTSQLLPTITMPSSDTITRAFVPNFTPILDAALDEYRSITGQDLDTHPFATAFDICDSPNTVLNMFEKQAQAFDRFRKDDDKLMRWLTPIVHVLFTISGTLMESFGLV
jgi:hypothetical protein